MIHIHHRGLIIPDDFLATIRSHMVCMPIIASFVPILRWTTNPLTPGEEKKLVQSFIHSSPRRITLHVVSHRQSGCSNTSCDYHSAEVTGIYQLQPQKFLSGLFTFLYITLVYYTCTEVNHGNQ